MKDDLTRYQINGYRCYMIMGDEHDEMVAAMNAENAQLKALIRGESVEPPLDPQDDISTELAVELAYANAEITRLRAVVEILTKRTEDRASLLGILMYKAGIPLAMKSLKDDVAALNKAIEALDGYND